MNMKQNTILILALLVTMMSLSASVNAQDWTIHGIDIYRWNVRNVDSAGWDYDNENETLAIRLIPRTREDTISSYGIALITVLFNVSSVPKKVSAYLYIGNETHDIIDQLKNYSIVEGQTFIKSNDTHQWEVEATYLEAFIYMFANRSIENELPIPRPNFGPWNNSYPPVMLASEMASYDSNVVFTMSYDDSTLPSMDLLFVLGVSIVAVVVVIAMVVYFLFFNEDS